MHRFFAPGAPSPGETVSLNAEEENHARRVLRLTAGSTVELIAEGGGRFLAELLPGNGAKVISPLKDNEPPVSVTVFMGMPKADKLEFVVQKAAELGADCVQPIQMVRSVAVWPVKDIEKRVERLKRISREAAKQCGRACPPNVLPPRPLKAALSEFSGGLLIMPWEQARAHTLKSVFESAKSAAKIGVIIGPEGGISKEEAEAAISFGAIPVTLGPRILRAETAAVAALSLVMGLWGDLS